MGASASLLENNENSTASIPSEIKTLLDVCERQKQKIAESEADLIEKEMAKMFKGHTAIIDRLTGHSKLQLQRLFLYHASTLRHLEELIEAGNHYAKFIKQLPKAKEDLEWEAILTSTKPDYDEELLVEILGCSTTEEIQHLDQIFMKEKSYCLADLFATQTKPDSQLRHFIERILRYDRDESKTIDKNLAIKQAAIIHRAGAARLIGVDEEPILDILATASRSQCAAINEMYIENYKMKLERAINMKFKGNCGKLMVLWTQPLPNAIVTCSQYICQKMLVDKNAVITFFAKYEKDILAQADEAAKTLHKKSLADLINQGISGNLHRAVKGWIELPSPDKGFERILDLYIQSRLNKGLTLIEILEDQELKTKIHFLIEKQAQEMKLYMIDHKIKLEPGDQSILAKSFTSAVRPVGGGGGGGGSNGNSKSEISLRGNSNSNSNGDSMTSVTSKQPLMTTPSTPVSSSSLSAHPSIIKVTVVDDDNNDNNSDNDYDDLPYHQQQHSHLITPSNLKTVPELREMEARMNSLDSDHQFDSEEYKQKSNKVYQYLIDVLEEVDQQGDGNLPQDLFWSVIQSLPLTELGLTLKEVEIVRQYSQWSSMDGCIYYYEVIFELCDSVIGSIENKKEGDRNVYHVIDQLIEQKKVAGGGGAVGGGGGEGSSQASRHVVTEAVRCSAKFLTPIKQNLRHSRVDLAEESLRKGSIFQYPNIPIFFRQYLMDTLTAFDLDCNGYLTEKEILSLLEVINIPELSLNKLLEEEEITFISPKEASDIILNLIDSYFTDGKEHYICLVDRDSGAYFWYNTLDGSTQWADSTTNTNNTTTTDATTNNNEIGNGNGGEDEQSPSLRDMAGLASATKDEVEDDDMKKNDRVLELPRDTSSPLFSAQNSFQEISTNSTKKMKKEEEEEEEEQKDSDEVDKNVNVNVDVATRPMSARSAKISTKEETKESEGESKQDSKEESKEERKESEGDNAGGRGRSGSNGSNGSVKKDSKESDSTTSTKQQLQLQLQQEVLPSSPRPLMSSQSTPSVLQES